MNLVEENLQPQAVARSIVGLITQKDIREAEATERVSRMRASCEYELQDILESLLELKRALTIQLSGTIRQGRVPEVGRDVNRDVVFHWGHLSVRFLVTELGVGWSCGEDTGLLRGEGAKLSAGQHALAVIQRTVEQRSWML